MQEGKFEELDALFQETFPELYEDLEKIRKGIPKEIEERQQALKEKMKKIKDDPNIKSLIQLEKVNPNHTKCDGKLLPENQKKSEG